GDYIHPSLIGFASYAYNESGSIMLRTQSFAISYSPAQILEGIGFAQPVIFNQNKIINITKISKNFHIADTTTTVSQFKCVTLDCSIIYVLNWVVYYPSSDKVGPLPLMEVDANEIYNEGLQSYLGGGIELLLLTSQSTTLSMDIAEGVDLKYASISYDIPGPSITLSYSSMKENVSVPFGQLAGKYPATQDIYINAQLALANYTVMTNTGIFLGYADQVLVTGMDIRVIQNNYLPVLYNSTNLYEKFDWSYAQNLLYIQKGNSYSYNLLDLLVSNNVLPNLVVSMPVAALIAAVAPEAALLAAPVLPNLEFIIQTTSIQLSVSAFYFMLKPAPYDVYVYYEGTNVQYQFGGNNYVVPNSIFYFWPNVLHCKLNTTVNPNYC
ncbi:MAG TPA: hypothetical protein VKU94_05255, partial [Geobacterales bacterium]|nr:hypothetical protein [Geobacterales bacterium]